MSAGTGDLSVSWRTVALHTAAPLHSGPDMAADGAREAVGAGDEASAEPQRPDFDGFVTAEGARLVGLARRSLRDPHAAEDVVQDVLARAYLRWDRISRLEDPRAYVNRMVLNACTSWWRRPARRETPVEQDADRGEEPQDVALVERDSMLQLLRRLPGKQRVVLVLRHYERMDDDEIARLLGVSTGTVRSNAFRGLARLRQQLGG